MRAPTHQGAAQELTHTTNLGPFDGQILDRDTGEPIADALLIAVWDYDEGDGFHAPRGREEIELRSDSAGRYRIPTAPTKLRGATVRLVSFTLYVYKRGYVAYRSDQLASGEQRRDFYQRHNKIALKKWNSTQSHAEHLFYISGPRVINQRSAWEAQMANLDLYREQTGMTPTPEESLSGTSDIDVPRTDTQENWLDARALLDVEGLKTRTGTFAEYIVQDLPDIPRSASYHGVHFQAQDRDVKSDFAYRVWSHPPDGLASVEELLRENLPGATQSEDVSEKTWIFENDELRAVAFIDSEQDAALLLTCGVELCADLDTAILLARHLRDSLDKLTTSPAQSKVNEDAVP